MVESGLGRGVKEGSYVIYNQYVESATSPSPFRGCRHGDPSRLRVWTLTYPNPTALPKPPIAASATGRSCPDGRASRRSDYLPVRTAESCPGLECHRIDDFAP